VYLGSIGPVGHHLGSLGGTGGDWAAASTDIGFQTFDPKIGWAGHGGYAGKASFHRARAKTNFGRGRQTFAALLLEEINKLEVIFPLCG